ncbi:hypothetical protein Fcan01_18403 [Folsomia candida]|uniref:Uncharacterized protein n=1 Tax=Folsomia candida TaxID=158441 RepID=A0A226DR29_FOLCA|nr:hypothetical protein Fcan01_18403 [Folsomia candida]
MKICHCSWRVLATVILLLLSFWSPFSSGQQDEIPVEQFQYKNIVLGVLIDTSSISILDKPGYQADLIAMINATITALNNGTYNPTHTAGTRRLPPINLATPSGSVGNIGGTLNVTKVSTVGLHVMEDIYDILENVPEMGALFTMLNCKDSHYMNTKITSQYGPIVHVAVTEPGCTRLSSTSAITVPLTSSSRNADLLQLLVDVRGEKVLPGWKEAIIINDVEAGDEIIDVFGLGFSTHSEHLTTITQTIYNVRRF